MGDGACEVCIELRRALYRLFDVAGQARQVVVQARATSGVVCRQVTEVILQRTITEIHVGTDERRAEVRCEISEPTREVCKRLAINI